MPIPIPLLIIWIGMLMGLGWRISGTPIPKYDTFTEVLAIILRLGLFVWLTIEVWRQ